jgi:hypothetical protein
MVHILVCRLLDASVNFSRRPGCAVVRWMRGDARALEGIPTSVKDEDAIAGWPVTAGSVLIKDNRAREHPGGRQAAGGGRRAARPDQTAPEFCFIPLDLEPGLWASPGIPGICGSPGQIGRIYPRAPPVSRAIDPATKDCNGWCADPISSY